MRALAAALLLAGSALAAERPKLVILELTPAGGTDPQLARAFTAAIATYLGGRGVFDVMSSNDVATLLGVERQKQLLGCGEGSSSCLTELSGALGARFIMNGTLARLGDAWQLSLTTLDSARGQPVGRSTRIAPSLAELQATLPWAVSEATASPPPETPSRIGPAMVMGLGVAALVAGATVGIEGLTQEAALNAELSNMRPGALDTRAQYQQRAQTPTLLKSIGLGAALGGAVLLAGGTTWLLLQGSGGGSTAKIALVPTGNGAALTGVWP